MAHTTKLWNHHETVESSHWKNHRQNILESRRGLVLLGELVKDGPSMLFAWDPQQAMDGKMMETNQKSPKAVSFPTTVLDGAKKTL